jgi:phosphate acetyltransferase
MTLPETAAAFIAGQSERIRRFKKPKKIVFPEGCDPRVVAAAGRLAAEGLVEPVLVGRPPSGSSGLEFVDPASSPLSRKYASLLYERRRAKGITQMEAAETVKRPLWFAALMVSAGDADGTVGSAAHTTAETVRADLQCIDLRPEFRRLSSVHFLAVQDRAYGHNGLLAFSDCAILVDPTPAELADIAIAAAGSARAVLDAEPLVALLSFSTKGSAKHRSADKVIEALRYIRQRAPNLCVDGELQADAALVPSVGRSKSPGSPVAGRANTLVFPDLNSANIGYKLVERLGGGALLAVLFPGLVRPASIVSRGCSAEDVYTTAVITAVQAGAAPASAV